MAFKKPILFMGLSLSERLESELARLSDQERSLFIREGEKYLQEMTFDGVRYLGKAVGALSDLPTLELLETNILSLLQKIFPRVPLQSSGLLIFPVQVDSSDS